MATLRPTRTAEDVLMLAEEAHRRFESLGESNVRKLIASNGFDSPYESSQAAAWLAEKEAEKSAAAIEREEKRSEKALEIASEANAISRTASRRAVWANLVSILAVIVAGIAAKDEVMSLLKALGLP